MISSIGLEAFLEVARTGSFTRAANNLGLTQSALSQRVQKLESDIETTLLLREKVGPKLTEAGELLLRHAQTTAEMESDLLSRLGLGATKGGAEGLRGVLRVGGFSSVMWPLVVPAFEKLVAKNAGLRLECMVRETRDLPGLLRTGAVDLIVADRHLDETSFESVRVGFERNVLVGPREELGARAEAFLDHDPEDNTTRDFFRLQKWRFESVRRDYLDDVFGILEGVRRGWGRAVVPEHLVLKDKQLVVDRKARPLLTPVFLVRPRLPYYSRLQRESFETLERGLRATLGAASQARRA